MVERWLTWKVGDKRSIRFGVDSSIGERNSCRHSVEFHESLRGLNRFSLTDVKIVEGVDLWTRGWLSLVNLGLVNMEAIE